MPLVYAFALAAVVGVLAFLAGLDVGRDDAERLRLYADDLEAEDEATDLVQPRPRGVSPGPRVVSPAMFRNRDHGGRAK